MRERTYSDLTRSSLLTIITALLLGTVIINGASAAIPTPTSVSSQYDPAATTPEWVVQYSTYLTKNNARHYSHETLTKKFSSYKYGTYKRLNRCTRLSRGKLRCNASWLVGDSFFHGRITARLESKGTKWSTSYRIKKTDEFCQSSLGRRKNCTKTYKGVSKGPAYAIDMSPPFSF